LSSPVSKGVKTMKTNVLVIFIALLLIGGCVKAQEQEISRLKTQTITLSRKASNEKTLLRQSWILVDSESRQMRPVDVRTTRSKDEIGPSQISTNIGQVQVINTRNRRYSIAYQGLSQAADDLWLRIEAAPAGGTGLLKDLGGMQWAEVDRMPALVLQPVTSGLSITISNGARIVGPQGLIVRALAGHAYAVHVKDDRTDLRVIFRIDSIEANGDCRISSKHIPSKWVLGPVPDSQTQPRADGNLQSDAPVIDYHQHLFSPAAAALVSGKPDSPGINARDLIALLDAAGIRRSLVLSMGYTWGKASRTPVENEYEHVKAENDWTAQQVAQYPDRLRAFCSFNPLKPYALEELARCSKDPQLHFGLKLHFGNSDVDLDNPNDVAQVKKIFKAANGYHMPIVVHLHTSFDKQRKYGADEARVFLNEVLASAPDVPVQIAHLAGAGGFDAATDAALGVFTEAIAKHDVRMKNVWFDVTVVVRPGMSADALQQIAARIRQIGVARVLYGSDAATNPLAYPKAGWAAFKRLPLTSAEFGVIANNIAPYMRDFGGGIRKLNLSAVPLSKTQSVRYCGALRTHGSVPSASAGGIRKLPSRRKYPINPSANADGTDSAAT
jgi:predicted TIM-barrel fold metal-dependent hydrolase